MGQSYIAALVAFFALIVGSVVVSGMRGAEFSALSDILFGRAADGSILRTALAWGWAALGLAAVAGAFISFITDEDDDPHEPRRRFPMTVPLIALAGSFALLWAIFAPTRPIMVAEAARVAPPATPAPVARRAIEEELAGGAFDVVAADPIGPAAAPAEPAIVDPIIVAEEPAPAEAARIIAAARPLTTSEETGFYWTYEYPLIRDGAVISSPEVDRALAAFMPMDDAKGAVAQMLCGKAWVAFSGSASEEGPADRNEMRARARAELVARRAEAWLDAHPDCKRPVIVALDLGQHAPTKADDPTDTAYQRQLIVIGRARASDDELIDALAAVEEMRVFYGNESMRARLLGTRHFKSEGEIFVPA